MFVVRVQGSCPLQRKPSRIARRIQLETFIRGGSNLGSNMHEAEKRENFKTEEDMISQWFKYLYDISKSAQADMGLDSFRYILHIFFNSK